MIPALLAVAALGTVVAAWFLGPAWLPWIALGLCLLGLVPYAWPVVLGWRERLVPESFGEGETQASESRGETTVESAEAGQLQDDSPSQSDQSANNEPDHPGEPDLVAVLPGRRRYHRLDCELLADRQPEIMTIEDAVDEAFSACSRCGGTDQGFGSASGP